MREKVEELMDKNYRFMNRLFPIFFYIFLVADLIIVILMIVTASLGSFSEVFEESFSIVVILLTMTIIFAFARNLLKREEKKAEKGEFISEELEEIFQSQIAISTSFTVFSVFLLISSVNNFICKTTIGCNILLAIACVFMSIGAIFQLYFVIRLMNKKRSAQKEQI